jgi:hypothetical protein
LALGFAATLSCGSWFSGDPFLLQLFFSQSFFTTAFDTVFGSKKRQPFYTVPWRLIETAQTNYSGIF